MTAADDLAELWAYLAMEATEDVATHFLEAIETRLHKLCYAPSIGSRRDMFAPDMRALPHGAYVIYYTATPTHLVIVRVLHGARDAQALAERGGFEAE